MIIDDLKEQNIYLSPEDEFSNAFGDGIRSAFRRTKSRVKSKVQKFNKKQVADQKKQEAEVAKLKAIDAQDTSMQDTLKALSKEPIEAKSGMSTGAKIGIAVVALALIGGGIWYYKKHKKK